MNRSHPRRNRVPTPKRSRRALVSSWWLRAYHLMRPASLSISTRFARLSVHATAAAARRRTSRRASDRSSHPAPLKCLNAATELGWQSMVPASSISTCPATGVRRGHHAGACVLQRVMKEVRLKAGITKPAGCHRSCWDTKVSGRP